MRPGKPKQDIKKIVKSIRLTLHPSYAQPIRHVANPNAKGSFEVTATAWGYFEIEIKVQLMPGIRAPDGKNTLDLTHELLFEDCGSHHVFNLRLPKRQAKSLGLL